MPSMKAQRAKRGRSPCPTTKSPSRRSRIGTTEQPHPSLCGCPASREVRRLKAQVAELEAELERRSALLTDAFHDDPDVQALRRRMEPPEDGHDTYASVASRPVLQEHVTEALVTAIRKVEQAFKVDTTPSAGAKLRAVAVDPDVTASWCVPHAAVPSVVAARVVLPFLAPDVVFIGAGPATVIGANAPATIQVDTLHALISGAEPIGLQIDCSRVLADLLTNLCAVTLPEPSLERLASVLSSPIANIGENVRWLETWCLFRLGRTAFDKFMSEARRATCSGTVFRSQVAVDEFFLPVASVCPVEEIAAFTELLDRADASKVVTSDFRDRFITRLANSPVISVESIFELACAIFVLCDTDAAPIARRVFLEPPFVLDFCSRGLTLILADERHFISDRCSDLFRGQASMIDNVTWPPSLVPSVRDRFVIPAVRWALKTAGRLNTRDERGLLLRTLDHVVRSDPEAAALFCTADFRDDFFIALIVGHSIPTVCALSVANVLTTIAAAAPRTQRQAVFATTQFRDTVFVALIRYTRRDPAALAAVRAAFLTIAENDDGSLHEVFTARASRPLLAVLKLLPSA